MSRKKIVAYPFLTILFILICLLLISDNCKYHSEYYNSFQYYLIGMPVSRYLNICYDPYEDTIYQSISGTLNIVQNGKAQKAGQLEWPYADCIVTTEELLCLFDFKRNNVTLVSKTNYAVIVSTKLPIDDTPYLVFAHNNHLFIMYTYWNGFYEISLTDGSSRLIDNVWGIVSADKDYIYVVDSEINRYVIDDYKSSQISLPDKVFAKLQNYQFSAFMLIKGSFYAEYRSLKAPFDYKIYAMIKGNWSECEILKGCRMMFCLNDKMYLSDLALNKIYMYDGNHLTASNLHYNEYTVISNGLYLQNIVSLSDKI